MTAVRDVLLLINGMPVIHCGTLNVVVYLLGQAD